MAPLAVVRRSVPVIKVKLGSALSAISLRRLEPLITCDIGKIYDKHFVTKKFVPCQNYDGFDKNRSHGLFSMYVNWRET